MSRFSESQFDVNGRTVLITGAARGIGAATAERLHGKGANVALVGLEPERLEALATRLGERAHAFEADVADYDAVQRAVDATVERFGAVDVAIANAGLAFTGALATAPIEQVERTFAVNLLGVWHTDRAVIGQISARQGYLLNISSLSAVAHAPLMGPYTATKAGVEAFSDALRMETAPSGARVGCAYFGFIDTDLTRAAYAQPSVANRQPPIARVPARPGAAVERGRRDRARHRTARRARLGAALGRRGDRAAQPRAAADRTAGHARTGAARGVDAPGRPRHGRGPGRGSSARRRRAGLTPRAKTPISR